jgi:hypothetical protein
MAVSDAPITWYSDTTAHKRAVSDYISLIDPVDTPVVAYFGLEGDPAAFRIVNWPVPKFEWLEDDFADLTDTLAASLASDSTTAQVTDGSLFKVGYVIQIGSEKLWISSVSTNTITVTRGLGGTSAASAANAAVTTVVSMSRLEGADTTDDYKTDVTAPYNFTQIFHGGVKVTRTMAKVQQYGIAGEYEYQVNKKIPELSRLIEKSFFNGERLSGTTSTPRSFGGLETFITDNTVSAASAALTRKDVEDRVQAIWEDGGTPDLMICNAWVKRKISGFYEDSVRTERSEERGGVQINYVETEFGSMRVLMSRWCPSTKLYIVTSEHVGFLPYDAFFTEPMAKTGDYVRGQVIGEYGLVVRHDKAHGLIKSISTTS